MPRTKRTRRGPAGAPPDVELAGLEQVRALSHPLRLRLLELFAARARTTKQAAGALAQPPTRLYHHVAVLERAGLVRLRETRPNRGTIEKYYEATPGKYSAGRQAEALLSRSPRELSTLGMMLFEQARTELIRALAGAQGRPEVLVAVRGTAVLSPAGAKRLARRLAALVDTLRRPPKAPRTARRGRRRTYALTIALVPTDGDPDAC